MRTSYFPRFVLATTLAAGTLNCRQPARERDTTAENQKITQVGEREVTAFNAGDIDRNLATLTQDVVMMPAGERVLTGADAVRSWLGRVHSQYTFSVRYTDSHIDVVGDWAIQRYTLVSTITPKKGGPPMDDSQKGIHIYRRQSDGSWLIAQDIWNSDSPSPATP
jgi:uncharacterized protein (TIGR02246 family)